MRSVIGELYQGILRFNKKFAIIITDSVSTMACAYLFCLLALLGLPPALKPGGSGIVAWVAQTFIQLVLLSVIMVGQKIQADQTIQHVNKKHDELKDHLTKLHKGK